MACEEPAAKGSQLPALPFQPETLIKARWFHLGQASEEASARRPLPPPPPPLSADIAGGPASTGDYRRRGPLSDADGTKGRVSLPRPITQSSIADSIRCAFHWKELLCAGLSDKKWCSASPPLPSYKRSYDPVPFLRDLTREGAERNRKARGLTLESFAAPTVKPRQAFWQARRKRFAPVQPSGSAIRDRGRGGPSR
ncbi:hypothetical protein SKAU_G00111080 [Synaphobranchus kaupii]|uniref:Uncharacterized protein n=1 Tax=Synaphobranchus kaupii TaxID=118154 RepID=A0A9Q1G199_SYNKA|nr:hypothetical protein SKAU_G00111080 [Synaphobranchus kaupii]